MKTHWLTRKLKGSILVLLLCLSMLALSLALPQRAVSAAAPIYVRPGGDDGLCDGTVNVDYSSGIAPACAVQTIQQGIDLVDAAGTVHVADGTYIEELIIDKALTLSGESQNGTIILPATSGPVCTSGGGSICTGGVNAILIQSSDVSIDHLTIDGDNPSLTSGVVRGSADLDARNGIIQDHRLGTPFTNLEISYVTVRNIYLRAIYASSAGNTFHIHHNHVENVRGEAASIAIMNWAGSGIFEYNTVDDVNDGIVSNHSMGTTYQYNTITGSDSGMHSDNNGSSGGTADVLQNNTISDCSGTFPYGLFVFASYLDVTVTENTISNCPGAALTFARPANTTSLTTFSQNTVDNVAMGIYITTGVDWGWGGTNVTVLFENNTISNTDTGVYFESDATFTLDADLHGNSITSFATAAAATGEGTGYTGTYNIDMAGNWWDTRDGAVIATSLDDPAPKVIDFSPWLDSGTDTAPGTPGFQPDLSALWVDDLSPKVGTAGYIQEAVDLVDTNGLVSVRPGTYTERLVVNKPVTLRGATYLITKYGYNVPANYAWDDTVHTIIEEPTPTVGGNTVDIVNTSNVTFEGFIVQNLAASGNTVNSLVRVAIESGATQASENIVVRNNIIGPFTNTTAQDGTHGRMGLYIATPNYINLGLLNCSFNDNLIFDAQGNGNNIFVWGAAENYHNNGNTDMTGTVIEHNEIYGAHRSGIEIAGGVDNLTIRDNFIHHNSSENGGTADPAIKYGNGIVIIRMGTDKDNPLAYGPANLTVEDNRIEDNEKHGIYIGPVLNDSLFDSNLLQNNGINAIWVDKDETYHGGTWPVTNRMSNVTFQFNVFLDNGQYGLASNNADITLDAINNWWGCNEGPGGVDCDAVDGSIDADPWLVLSVTLVDNPASTQRSTVVDVEALLQFNSDGADTSSLGSISHSLDTTFSASLGTIIPMNTLMVNSVASATYYAYLDMPADICATIDYETACTTFMRYLIYMPLINR
jgi:hypothetical protein